MEDIVVKVISTNDTKKNLHTLLRERITDAGNRGTHSENGNS